MTADGLPKILCVDDDVDILKGLKLNFRRHFYVLTAESGEQGLALLQSHPDVAAVLSDMRMPEMDGAQFLARVRQRVPQATRLLLTGQADLEAAIRAVNQGHLFRFLTKPCPTADLQQALNAAVEQHRLQQAEKELLEQTLFGSVEALSDALAIAVPEVYGGIASLRRVAAAMGERAGLTPAWPLQISAMLAYVGYVGLPREVAARAVAGETLSQSERDMLAAAPQTAGRVLAHIPRLEPVRAIISLAHQDPRQADPDEPGVDIAMVRKAAGILKAAMEYCRLLERNASAEEALADLQSQPAAYDRNALDALADYVGMRAHGELLELKLPELQLGMTLAEGLRTSKGVLIAPQGYEVTPGFLERLQNFERGSVMEPVRVLAAPPDARDAP